MSEINDITPEQAVKLFETGRGVILDEILRKVPDFDIHHANEEHFRALVLLGVKSPSSPHRFGLSLSWK